VTGFVTGFLSVPALSFSSWLAQLWLEAQTFSGMSSVKQFN
jgi:hypothetical protein